MQKPRSHTNLEQEKQRSIIKSNPTKHHQIQPKQEKQTIRGKTQRWRKPNTKTKCMRKKEPCRRFLEASQTEKYSLNSRKYGVPLDLPGFVVFAKDQRAWVCCCREIWVRSWAWDLGSCRKFVSALLWVCVGSGFLPLKLKCEKLDFLLKLDSAWLDFKEQNRVP